MRRTALHTLASRSAAILLTAFAVAACSGGATVGSVGLQPRVPIGTPDAASPPTVGDSSFGLSLRRDTSGAPLGVTVSWTRVDDGTVTGYYIYRHEDTALPDGDPAGHSAFRVNGGNLIGQSGAGTETLTFDDDFDPAFGTVWHYRITVVNNTSDESDFSNDLEITIAEHTVDAVSQAGGSIGDQVTITGTWFGDTQDGDTVYFSDSAGDIVVAATTYVSWTMTEIVVEIPYGAADGPVSVDIAGTVVESVDTVDYSEPGLTGLSQAEDYVQHDYIILTGSDFGPPPSTGGDDTVVYFGTTPALTADFDESAWTTTSIKVKVPAAAVGGTVQVYVDVAGNLSPQLPFLILPHLNNLSSSSGSVGASVTLNGTNFGATQGSSKLRLNGHLANVTAWSNTAVTVQVPGPATDGNWVLSRGDNKATNGIGYDVVPTLTAFTPTRRLTGETVTITGSGYGNTRGTSKVTLLGGTVDVTTYVSWANNQIVFTVPAGATTGKLRVTVVDNSVGSNLDTATSGPNLALLLPPADITDIGQLQ